MDCSFTTAFNFNDIFFCAIQSFGVPFDLVAIGIIIAIVLFALMSRLDFDMSLAFAIAVTWALYLLSGQGSYVLMYIFYLLMIGMGIRMLMAIIAIFRQ